MKKQEKGITLIALIITIIVMLILVGVTINVALNGGLFTKAEQATYQMEASMVKEQFEIAKAVAISNNGGEKLEDYSTITIDSLDLDANTKNKYKDKIFMSAEGDVCYNADNVTEKEKEYLEAVGINPGKKVKTGYSFTLNELGEYTANDDSRIGFNPSNVWNVVGEDLSQNINYGFEGNAFALEADSELFAGYIQVEYGIDTIGVDTKFLVLGDIHFGQFEIAVYDINGNEILQLTPDENEMTHSDFIDAYGDVEFTFVKLSELGIVAE